LYQVCTTLILLDLHMFMNAFQWCETQVWGTQAVASGHQLLKPLPKAIATATTSTDSLGWVAKKHCVSI
jgi:hypothetical protein